MRSNRSWFTTWKGGLIGASLALASASLFPTPALAFPEPPPAPTGNSSLPSFLPAPNPTAFCESPDYFGVLNELTDLLDAGGNLDINPNFDQNGDGDPTTTPAPNKLTRPPQTPARVVFRL